MKHEGCTDWVLLCLISFFVSGQRGVKRELDLVAGQLGPVERKLRFEDGPFRFLDRRFITSGWQPTG
jgi:hypothetical protein